MNIEFITGAMGCGKTAQAVLNAKRAEIDGQKPICISPAVDTRMTQEYSEEDGIQKGRIISRETGLSYEAYILPQDEMLSDFIEKIKENHKIIEGDSYKAPDCYILDEVQFLSVEQMSNLLEYHTLDDQTQLFLYGLMTTSQVTLFDSINKLIAFGVKPTVIPSKNSKGKENTINAKFRDGYIVLDGEVIDVGGDDKYKAISVQDYFMLTRLERERQRILNGQKSENNITNFEDLKQA